MGKTCLFKLTCGMLIAALSHSAARAQSDTIRVMAYNVLDFGAYPLCQGPNGIYLAYLDTIVQFANPDILSLEKMGSIQTSPSDHSYSAAIGFQDSILQNALNLAYPGRYNYCPFTNYAASNTQSVLFYNQQKLGYVNTTCTYVNTEDFNTYKLYYKDPNLATTHDTTYLYVTVNHDQSGNSTADGTQIGGEMSLIQQHFTHLANMVNMGDFNLRSSSEPCYQILTAPSDTNFRYYDPPFYPDANLSYPANWDGNPSAFAKYLTTSTRTTEPNSCSSSTTGGGKDWYDHIFLSPWIINNANYIHYIPNSFRVIGNDGHRVSVAINASPTNTSAPPSVINSLYQMSNKYPVMVDLEVTSNTSGASPQDPEIVPSAVKGPSSANAWVRVVNPAVGKIILHVSGELTGQALQIECTDVSGRMLINETVVAADGTIEVDNKLTPGMYIIKVSNTLGVYLKAILSKE